MGRLGVATVKPIHNRVASGGGQFPKGVDRSPEWLESALPTLASRLISESKVALWPVRIFPDATGAGGVASLTLMASRNSPLLLLLLLQSGAEQELHFLATPRTRFTFPSSSSRYVQFSN